MNNYRKKHGFNVKRSSSKDYLIVRGSRSLSTYELQQKVRLSTLPERQSSKNVFVGPSVEGADRKYVKVLSGKVDLKKPSFV